MMVARVRSRYGLKTRYARLRARGMLTLAEIEKHLDISTTTAKPWRCAGLLRTRRYNDRAETLSSSLDPAHRLPISTQNPCLTPSVATHSAHEVHYAAQAFCHGEGGAVRTSHFPSLGHDFGSQHHTTYLGLVADSEVRCPKERPR